jgi:hypothetical protein
MQDMFQRGEGVARGVDREPVRAAFLTALKTDRTI